jgi:(4S)-4-hydroxy-5-phosphonooxypentane-2,3-dione isomerase
MKGLWHDSEYVKPAAEEGRAVDGFVILARFRIAPGRHGEFLDHIGRNAAASLAREPGCRRFDVLTDVKGADVKGAGANVAGADARRATDEVVLYEIYDDQAAFIAHLETPHFAAFRAATESIVLSSAVERFHLREGARAD